jgi:hypothetical protein
VYAPARLTVPKFEGQAQDSAQRKWMLQKREHAFAKKCEEIGKAQIFTLSTSFQEIFTAP